MSIVIQEAEPRWSYSHAARLFGRSRQTVSEVAQVHMLNRPGEKPLDRAAMVRLAELLNVAPVEFSRAS